ncbi:MAG: tetratricopeptide repeat protein [Bacteroidetes bacterium]|nr:tetratricopeptide repeat protein [Bacteroidota bacterium]
MKRNQIIVISVCALLGIGIYFFANTTKPAKKEEATQPAMPDMTKTEALNIEEYVAETSAKIEDQATREKVEQLQKTSSYKELADVFVKLDKPLAVAYYAVKQAEASNQPNDLAQAGDYNAMLLQTAPDAKAQQYLMDNMVYCYKKSYELDSNNTDNKIRYASSIIQQGGAPMRGVSMLLDIVRKDSTNLDAQMMLGRFAIVSGQFEKALARFDKILYLSPQNQEALLLAAQAYEGKGDTPKAIEMLERCKKTVKDPNAQREIDNYIKQLSGPATNKN